MLYQPNLYYDPIRPIVDTRLVVDPKVEVDPIVKPVVNPIIDDGLVYNPYYVNQFSQPLPLVNPLIAPKTTIPMTNTEALPIEDKAVYLQDLCSGSACNQMHYLQNLTADPLSEGIHHLTDGSIINIIG